MYPLISVTDQPDIFIGDVRIQEPVIAVTSFLVAAFAFVGYYKTRNTPKHQPLFLYRMFVLVIGISCVASGFLGHAFSYNVGVTGKYLTWFTSMIGVSLAQQASFSRLRPYIVQRTYVILSVANLAQLLALMSVTFFNPSFVVVEIHSAIGMLFTVCGIETWLYIKSRSRISLNIMVGISMMVFAVLFHIFKISATHWFTYFDFGHIFMSLCVFFFWISILRYHAIDRVPVIARE